MIHLVRLHSDSGLLDEITFRRGLNVILGVQSGDRNGRELNGVGKSTLIRLVDYAFIGTEAKSYFRQDRTDFLRDEDHSITLTFEDDKSQYQIRRKFSESDEVEFAKAGAGFATYSEAEMKDILAPMMIVDAEYPGHVDTAWFRNLLRFFITDDKTAHRRTDPLNFVYASARKSELLAYNYYLLNLPNQHLVEFDRLRQKLQEEQRHKRQIEARIKEETGKAVEQVRSDLDRMRSQIEEYKANLEAFTFLQDYESIETELRTLTAKISDRMRVFAALRRRLSHLEKSYELKVDVDVERVSRLYAEIEVELAAFVQRRLEEILDFRRDIVANRKKFLVEREAELRSNLANVESEVKRLEERRSQLFKWLQERQALDALRNAYERIAHDSEQLERSAARVRALEAEEQKIAETNALISETVVQIVRERQTQDVSIREIRKTFFDILQHTIYLGEAVEDAYFDITATGKSASPLNVEIEVPKSDSLGKSRFKLPVYDLTVFLRILSQDRHLPHFLVHDGAFNGVDVKTVVQFLNYIEQKAGTLSSLQYIVTLNEDQVYLSEKSRTAFDGLGFELASRVIAHFEDVPEKMIFRREY
jgi:uncharacterized protein YydD (DUF2326 family)